MKFWLICLFALACGIEEGYSRILVYKGAEKAVVTGLGLSSPLKVQSYVVINPDTRLFLGALVYYTSGTTKSYSLVTNWLDFTVQQDIAGKTGANTVIAKAIATNTPSPRLNCYFVKGVNVTLATGNNETAMYPKTMKGVVRTLVYPAGFAATYESTVTLQYSIGDTQQANVTGETAEQFFARIAQQLDTLGFAREANQFH